MAPLSASTPISFTDISFKISAPSTFLGSPLKTPSASVTIMTQSAFKKFPRAYAVTSEPPLPKVVTFPSRLLPKNPHTTGTTPLSIRGSKNFSPASMLCFGRIFAPHGVLSVIMGKSSLFGSKYCASIPIDLRVAAMIRADVASPIATISDRNVSSILSPVALFAVFKRLSVTPAMADTTTIISSPFFAFLATAPAASLIRSASPTLVPPNFTTILTLLPPFTNMQYHYSSASLNPYFQRGNPSTSSSLSFQGETYIPKFSLFQE